MAIIKEHSIDEVAARAVSAYAATYGERTSSDERDRMFQQLADLYLNDGRTLTPTQALQDLVHALERLIELPELSGVPAPVMSALVKALRDTFPNKRIGESLADWVAHALGFAARGRKRPFVATLGFSKGSDALITVLAERLRDRSSRARELVVIFLCELRDERCRSILIELAEDQNELVAGNAKVGLSYLPPVG